jgi:homoserine O-acetyltransferase/O-succinyltransferase
MSIIKLVAPKGASVEQTFVQKNNINQEIWNSNQTFELESGQVLPHLRVHYHTYGEYVPGETKVLWVCHALTGSSDVFDWWNDFVSGFKSKGYFIICANVIGSCYGSIGPNSTDIPNEIRLNNFPLITPRDMARAHELLRSALQISKIDILVGPSLGGQQALEWAIQFPDRIKELILIATNAQHSPYGIAFNESQRLAILNDPSYGNNNSEGGKKGLEIARSIAMLSYRSYSGFGITQQEESINKLDDFKASSYQRYQGAKLANRFSAYAYVTLSKAMDAHHVGRGRESVEQALNKITARTLVIGIDSDLLFPLTEQKFLRDHIPNAVYTTISSGFGHDGFLVENEKLIHIVEDFITNGFRKYSPTQFKLNRSNN